MTDIKLTKSGTHYFHLLLKTYSGSKKSARLNWRQARQAANYQMLVVANDKEMIKTYGILIATGFITATAFFGHGASLDIVLGLLVLAVSAPLSAYIQIILAERFTLSLPVRYGLWFSLGASATSLLFAVLPERFITVPAAWITAVIICFVFIITITHVHYGEMLHFKTFAKAYMKNRLQVMLPYQVRGEVLRLSARDKYVSVRTAKGECEIRSTISEAIKLNSQPGYRIHRSHWVALDSVTDICRKKKKWYLTIQGPETFPVSAKIAPQIEQEVKLKTLKQENDRHLTVTRRRNSG
jgi:hypothetical protein